MHSTQQLATVFAGALVACGGPPQPSVYVAPTSETIFTTTEEMRGKPGQIVYIENHSSVRILVISASLHDCENIKDPCTSRRLSLPLAPGDRRALLWIEPENPQRAYTYQKGYGWRADSSSVRPRLGAISLENDSAALLNRAGSLRVLPESLVVHVGSRVALDTIRVLLISKQGETLGRLLNVRFHLESALASLIAPDTIVGVQAGRTALQLTLPQRLALGRAASSSVLLVPVIVRE